jgi:alpha-glucosidase
MAYYASGLDLPANFHLLTTPWTRGDVASSTSLRGGAARRRVAELGPRQPRRRGSRAASGPSRRAAAVLLLTLARTPTLYYGDEIGMRDVPCRPTRAGSVGRRVPGQGLGAIPSARRCSGTMGRTPASARRGGSWLPLADDADAINVARPTRRPALDTDAVPRAARPAAGRARAGGWLLPDGLGRRRGVLVFERGDELRVALNLSGEPSRRQAGGVVLLGTDPRARGETLGAGCGLAGGEAVIV